ncbi:hypothetical protein [Desulforhabdus sp. TSK]|uniref:hypothetical protein n=1 Tax=Desulforhabdus sp. TSK TaxID=2925014 RepID=UPI001FC881B2|nr:hypothetical protein [Desulforhabdus sp. TSK]GKT09138.1 hypothetical protein DSTSK_24430 [Desulforhabdus sp. TSK]
MEIFGPLSLLAVMIFGFLVMFGIVPLRKVGKSLVLLLLFIALAPMFFSSARSGSTQFFSMNHSWWVYLVLFFGILVVIRVVLSLLFPSRRR